MKKTSPVFDFLLAVAFVALIFPVTAGAVSVFQVVQGGTGVGTLSANALVVGKGTSPVYTVGTTTASCAGSASCTAFTIIGSSPITITGSGGGTGLSTSSPVSGGNVLVYSAAGAGSAFGVATGTVSAGSSAITVTAGRSVIGGALSVDCATASGSQNGCLSSSDWTTFNNKVSSSSLLSQYPFQLAGNATSTLTQFNGGLTAYGSSTIGDASLGLTINGTATTTGKANFTSTVLIGTTTAPATLNVATAGSSNNVMSFSRNDNTTKWTISNLNNNFNIGSFTGASANTGNVQFSFASTGNFGIATTAPYAKLSVGGLAVVDNVFATSTTATSTFSGGLAAGNNAAFNVNQVAPINSLVVTASGNIAIGTSTATVPLTVFGTGVNVLQVMSSNALSATSGSGISYFTTLLPTAANQRLGFNTYGYFNGTNTRNAASIEGFSSQAWTDGSAQGEYLIFDTTANGSSSRTERMRIDQNGYVGIASSTPNAALSVGSGTASSSISVAEYAYGKSGNNSTSTAATLSPKTANTILWPIGSSATTLTLCDFQPGDVFKIVVVNPTQSAGALTWTTCSGYQLYWAGGTAPSQTTTAGKRDVWSFIGTDSVGSSTPNQMTIEGAMTANF